MAVKFRMDTKVTDRGSLGGVAGQGLSQRVDRFLQDVERVRTESAKTATDVSRATVRNRKNRRATAPSRNNRYSGLADAVRWRPIGKNSAAVGLALKDLEAKFKPWLVHEIGTGQRAIQRVSAQPNPVGRPKKGATYVKSVKSQVGRRIKTSLVWAQGGQYASPSNATRSQQLHLRSKVEGAPIRFDPVTKRAAPGFKIGKEIDALNYIQKGGDQGFREYRESVLTAARQQMKKKKPR